jgi:hypothetical protein
MSTTTTAIPAGTVVRRAGEVDPRELPARPSVRDTWTRPVGGHAQAIAAAALRAMPPASDPASAGAGRPAVTVVVDPAETITFARAAARLACRRAGRIVVHTSPYQGAPWALGIDLLCALGKHWDRTGQGCDIHINVLVDVWLRAERVRDLIVLRAHQLTGKALTWLVDLAHRHQVRLWLLAPDPLDDVDPAAPRRSPAAFLEAVRLHRHCRCDDLNRPPPPVPPPATRASALPWATGRLLRRLHDPEAAALAAVTLLLGRPDLDELIAGEPLVDQGARRVSTADGYQVRVPEHARGLLRGWAGRALLPPAWAPDVAAAYLVVRLEAAGRHAGLPLLDPARPPDSPVAWHLRSDPGADVLEWLTQSRWRRPAVGTVEGDLRSR